MKRSCLNCKYKYEPESINDFFEKTGEKPGCDWFIPAFKRRYTLCTNNSNSQDIYVDNSMVLRRCIDFNKLGLCPFYQEEEVENIKQVSFSIQRTEVEHFIKLIALPDPVTPPVEGEPPAQILSFKYQWYKNGRKLFREKGTSISIDIDKEKPGTYDYYCSITEEMANNGDGGNKVTVFESSHQEVKIEEKPAPEPII